MKNINIINKNIFQVQTGDFKTEVEADNFNEAIIKAFNKEPPENPGMFVRCRLKNPTRGIIEHKKLRLWNYVSIEKALEIAGYSINK